MWRSFKEHGLTQRSGDESGNTALEMALVLPVFFLMVFGFINFCLVVFGMCNANFASRAALRYATVHSSTSYTATTQQGLDNLVGPYIFAFPSNTWKVTANYLQGSAVAGNVVGSNVVIKMKITYNLNFLGYDYSGISYNSTASGVVVQ